MAWPISAMSGKSRSAPVLDHGAFVAKELHPHRPSLSNTPRSSAGLPQGVQRVSRLVEEDCRKIQQVESGFDELGMADYDLHTLLDLSRVPSFALRRVH